MAEPATSENIFQRIAKWGRNKVLRPVLDDTGYLPEVFAAFGLNAQGQQLNVPPGTLASIDEYIQKESKDADIQALMVLVEDAKTLYEIIRDLVESAQANDEFTDDNLVSDIIQYFMFDAVRRDVPQFYNILAVLEAFDEAGQHEGGTINLVKAIGGYFEQFGLSHDLADEDQAKRLSDVYFIGGPAVLSLLGLIAGPAGFKIALNNFYKYSRLGYDGPEVPATVNADTISRRALSFSITGKTTNAGGDELAGTAYLGLLFIPRNHGGPAFLLGLEGVTALETPISPNWNALIELSAGTSYIRIGNQGGVSGNTDGFVKIGFKRNTAGALAKQVIGDPGGTRLEIGPAEISAKASATDFEAKVKFTDTKVVISPGQDGFLASFMDPRGMTAALDLGLGYSYKRGSVFLDGGSGLMVTLPMHLQVGPVHVQALYVQLKGLENPAGLETELSVGFSVVLGPLTVTLDRFGLRLVARDRPGESVPWDFKLAVKPPNGIGLSVDAALVKGGGFLFLDPDNDMYAGALELSIQGLGSIAAVGVIQTRLPDGGPGFSMFIIISVEFTPGFQLGLGFFLTGLGGMLGLNRTVAVEPLIEGVRNNALDNILFPKDVVANAPTIIRQIQAIFPPKRDQFIIGLMAKITWGTSSLVELQFGLMIEFSNPVRFAILGVLKITIPTPQLSTIRIQVNFVGLIDFDKGLLSFDASLFDSKLATCTLAGDMALRLSWGADPGFLVSVGGFHPSFTPPAALQMPKMKRLTIKIFGDNPKLVVQCYLAVTSNTFQIGARVDFTFKVSKFSVIGYLGFDVLFQFSPFKFIAKISAGLEVKIGSTSLFSITLEFTLSGPGPWNAQGTAKFKILFFTIKVSFNITWGEAETQSEISVQVQPLVLEAARSERNWIAELPANRYDLVSLREIPSEPGEVVLQTFGSLRITQNVLPLNFTINRFGNDRPVDIQLADFTQVRFGGKPMAVEDIYDNFAPALFRQLADEDKLKSASFTKQKSGIRVTATDAVRADYAANRPVEYEVKVSDFNPEPVRQLGRRTFNKHLFIAMCFGGAVGKSALSVENSRKATKQVNMQVADEQYAVVSNKNLKVPAGAAFTGGSQADAQAALTALLAAQPHLKDELQVVPAYHVVA